ncbi:MAG: hypothetical protein LBC09_05735, partial [Helicobacteraceae bacterium]|nr:hypothetical protein [Helicobacteraceae bacterium]
MHFLIAFLTYLFFAVITIPLVAVLFYIIYFVFALFIALWRKRLNLKPAFKLPLKPTKQGLKYALIFFVSFHAFFYLYRSIDYFIGDRPYKEAKAYAIAGDYLCLWQLLFGNYRTVDTAFFQSFQKLQQKFVIEPIYSIIPESDAERDIWLYKFWNQIYARSY